MSNKRKTAQRFTYARGRRAFNMYGARVVRQAVRAIERPVADFESHAAYKQWRESLPVNVRAVLTMFECEACMDIDQRMLANAH